jgi:phosphatidylethanolamine-binding protein
LTGSTILLVLETNSTPSLTIQPANSSAQLTDKYTLTMVDASIVGATPDSNVRHWLVNDVTINGNSVINGTNAVPEQYVGPLPPKGSGSHRYVILLYKQPADFKNPDGFQQGLILNFNLTQYTQVGISCRDGAVIAERSCVSQDTNLGHPVAGSYFQVAGEGPASQSVSQTSAVVTSTLPAAKSTSTTGSGASSKPTNGATSLAVTSVAALAAGLVAAAALS